MSYLTDDKLVIIGAAGAIGSNMMQTALALELTPNVVGYDPFAKGMEGVSEEMCHCAFPGANISWTDNLDEALDGASYFISSGGAPRKEGMTREDLLKGNCEIAEGLGKAVKRNCPDLKLGVIIFNPADITGLTVLVHSGLAPSRIATLAALDSTRLQTALAQEFGVPQSDVTGCRTYGGHGEKMAVFASSTQVQGTPLTELIGSDKLSLERWDELRQHVCQGGKRIIQLRGRSSFQSPSHQSVLMVRAAMGGPEFAWPSGTYVNSDGFDQIMMAMETTLGSDGVSYRMPEGTDEEIAALRDSCAHLSTLRDEVIEMGVLPPLDQWSTVNPNL